MLDRTVTLASLAALTVILATAEPARAPLQAAVITGEGWAELTLEIVVIIGGLFHISVRPPEYLYKALRMGNIEGALASGLAVFFAGGFYLPLTS